MAPGALIEPAWPGWTLVLIVAGTLLAVYAAIVLVLLALGRRTHAVALARFVPDCLVLFRRVLGDPRVGRSRKLVVVALLGYLAMPFDLVPDFIPVVGQLDDVIVVALVLRLLVRAGGQELLREHWPGPRESLDLVIRIAYPVRREG